VNIPFDDQDAWRDSFRKDRRHVLDLTYWWYYDGVTFIDPESGDSISRDFAAMTELLVIWCYEISPVQVDPIWLQRFQRLAFATRPPTSDTRGRDFYGPRPSREQMEHAFYDAMLVIKRVEDLVLGPPRPNPKARMSIESLNILRYVAANPGCRGHEIALAFGFTKEAAYAQIRRNLRGLVESPGCGYYLSEAGQRVL
jgi:hypothetical protein